MNDQVGPFEAYHRIVEKLECYDKWKYSAPTVSLLLLRRRPGDPETS